MNSQDFLSHFSALAKTSYNGCVVENAFFCCCMQMQHIWLILKELTFLWNQKCCLFKLSYSIIAGTDCIFARWKKRARKPEKRLSQKNKNVGICFETRKVIYSNISILSAKTNFTRLELILKPCALVRYFLWQNFSFFHLWFI